MTSHQTPPSDQKPDSPSSSKLAETELASTHNLADKPLHSPLSGNKSFAVAGLGGLGSFVVGELAAVKETRVLALSRQPSVKLPEGVKAKASDCRWSFER